MFRNYLKVALRNLSKNKAYAAINIMGLALGLMATIIVFLFVSYETSYDEHFKDSERIYRTGIKASMMGQVIDGPIAANGAAHSFRTEFDEVESATRFQAIRQEIMLRHEQNRIYIQKGVRSDSMFFSVFEYEFIHGDPATCLTDQNSMVITETTARKFFDDENPMGKIINFDERQDHVVTAVVKEPVGQTHFVIDFWVDQNEIQPMWMSHNHHTYLKLKEGADSELFLEHMTEKFFSYIAPEVERFLKVSLEEFLETDNSFEYDIQALTDIHLTSHRDYELQQNGNRQYIYIFIAIALLVILIAGINFMNLSTARSSKRAKEVGIRKVSGATRGMLISQFLMESIIQSVIALFLAFIMVELFLPVFNNIMASDLQLFNDHFGTTVLFALLITVGYGLFAGSYPAFYLSGFEPVNVLKGNLSTSNKRHIFSWKAMILGISLLIALIISSFLLKNLVIVSQVSDNFFIALFASRLRLLIVFAIPLLVFYMVFKIFALRGILIVTQFTASVILIIGMMIIFQQINFMQNKDLGFNGDQVLVVPIQTDQVADNFRDYKSVFLSHPNVINVSRASWLPADPPNQTMFGIEGRQDALPFWNMGVDYDFMETMGMKIAEGRGLNRDLDHDSSLTLLVNQAAVNNLSIENPIGTRLNINLGGEPQWATIVGVLEDFHIEGFNNSIKPMVFYIDNYTWFATMKIEPENMSETITYLETKWNEIEPSHPFRYTFMDEKFAVLYAQQVRFGKIFLYLTILAIIISCMGLYGLASFTAEQRTKEIGIRKVLGASVPELMRMLSIDFILLVMLAIIIATPVVVILAKNWLSNFTYQIDMPWLPFVYASFLSVAIALLTVSYQAYMAAIKDPVRAIKYE